MRCTFPLALTFLTIIPWPGVGAATAQELARALFWFPWIGFLLGLLYWITGRGLLALFPPAPAAGLLVLVTVILTRGLHLDGLADTADGLGGGRTPEQRLAIMKDSRLGAFGALGLILVLLLKFVFLEAGLTRHQEAVLPLFPLISRWGMVLLAAWSPYARPGGGLGQPMVEGATWPRVGGATVAAILLGFLAGGFAALLLLAIAALAVLLLRAYFRRQLGGITGDVLGAANEILEVLILAVSLPLEPLPWSLAFPAAEPQAALIRKL